MKASEERDKIKLMPHVFEGRREPLHPLINEEMIKDLVHRFYDRVRQDKELGPIFNKVIDDQWDYHLNRMCDFWSSVALKTGRYKGKPVPAHMAIDQLTKEHFSQWLHMFRQTAVEVCGAEIGIYFIERSERIAESLQLALFYSDKIAPPGAFQNQKPDM